MFTLVGRCRRIEPGTCGTGADNTLTFEKSGIVALLNDREKLNMGDVAENEQKWENLARTKGYNCCLCGILIPFGERDVYFEKKLCGHCENTLSGD